MAGPLHIAAALRNLGARDLRALERVEVVGFVGREVVVLAALVCCDDGLYRERVDVDPATVSAIALRLCLADERRRLTQATATCTSRCSGLAVVEFDALAATTRWEFGPGDARQALHDPAMMQWWQAASSPSTPSLPLAKALPAVPETWVTAGQAATSTTSATATRAHVLQTLRPLAAVARLLGGAV